MCILTESVFGGSSKGMQVVYYAVFIRISV